MCVPYTREMSGGFESNFTAHDIPPREHEMGLPYLWIHVKDSLCSDNMADFFLEKSKVDRKYKKKKKKKSLIGLSCNFHFQTEDVSRNLTLKITSPITPTQNSANGNLLTGFLNNIPCIYTRDSVMYWIGMVMFSAVGPFSMVTICDVFTVEQAFRVFCRKFHS